MNETTVTQTRAPQDRRGKLDVWLSSAPAARSSRWGLPQREEDFAEPAPPSAAPEGERRAPKAPPAIDFRNPLALRAAFLAALLANLLTLFPYLFLAAPLWLVGAGFLAVHVYLRRSGQALSVASGARVGWITGVFAFAIFTVFFTFNFLAAVRSGIFTDRARLSQVPLLRDNLDQVIELMQSPVGMALNLVFSLAVLFMLFALFSIAGGALGAKLLRKH
jgi:hypothetical protein